MKQYYCPECDILIEELWTMLDHDSLTSIHFGMRLTEKHSFIVCAYCGSDVQDVPAESEDDDENCLN